MISVEFADLLLLILPVSSALSESLTDVSLEAFLGIEGLEGGTTGGFLLSLGGGFLVTLLGVEEDPLNTSRGLALGFLLLCTPLSPILRIEGLS
tara:strand:- start:1533 stop:1814 length:282 start_codon:yes stop_codon:yes gene_type:complete